MDLEEENDYIEDEYCVYIDFESSLTSIETNDPSLDVKIIGIDSESPIVEVNGKIFKGNYDYAYCTNVLFEEDKNEQSLDPDPIYEKVNEKFFRLLGKTNKKLTMKRIFLESIIKDEKKHADERDMKSGQDQLDKEQKEETLEELKTRLEVNTTYQDALNLLLSPGREPPRKIEENPLNLEFKPNIPNFENSAEMYEYVEDCDDDDNKDPDYDPSKEDS